LRPWSLFTRARLVLTCLSDPSVGRSPPYRFSMLRTFLPWRSFAVTFLLGGRRKPDSSLGRDRPPTFFFPPRFCPCPAVRSRSAFVKIRGYPGRVGATLVPPLPRFSYFLKVALHVWEQATLASSVLKDTFKFEPALRNAWHFISPPSSYCISQSWKSCFFQGRHPSACFLRKPHVGPFLSFPCRTLSWFHLSAF